MGERVLVTGMGMITPLGKDVISNWQSVIAGRSGITRLTEGIAIPGKIINGGQIKDYNWREYFTDIKGMSKATQFANIAAMEALEQSGLTAGDSLAESIDPKRIGVYIGTGGGGQMELVRIWERAKEGKRLSPYEALVIEPEQISARLGMRYKIKGPVATVSSACATGGSSLVNGARLIIAGEADAVVAGGAEAVLHPLTLLIYDSTRALSRWQGDPGEASKPFDKKRDGFVMSEGAGVLILESESHAKKRGAKVYGELVSYGETSDGNHPTDPSGEGAYDAMDLALNRAGIYPSKVDYINAHGTGTIKGDPAELEAIISRFKKDIYGVAISSTKSMTGHLMGAAGACEAIFSILSIKDGILPPTINLDNPIIDSFGFSTVNLVPNIAQRRNIEVALSNSFGFGGINVSLLFRRYY